MDYLVVGDFGTTGLTGDIDANSEKEEGNNFWGFFRSIGISSKGEDAAGSWGLGKWVFPDASKINAYLGLTRREHEDNWLLMGMTLLRTHHLGENPADKYHPYGFFAAHSGTRDEEWFSSIAVQRWDFGTVAAITPPSDDERRMTDVPMGATFRIFVVATNGSGRLLGHAPRIKPVMPLNSLLPLQEDDLGDEAWRVDFTQGVGNPVLLVNSAIPGISEIVRHDPEFRSLVMPEVFRIILMRMIFVEQANAEDEDGDWADWFAIARAYLPAGTPPNLPKTGPVDTDNLDAAHEWIGAVVNALANKPLDAATPTGTQWGARHERRRRPHHPAGDARHACEARRAASGGLAPLHHARLRGVDGLRQRARRHPRTPREAADDDRMAR